jgi:hypothetical protein
MAAQAIIENLLGLQLGKRHDRGFTAARRHMRAPRAVAALAPGVIWRFFAGSNALEVRVLVKLRPNVRMAGFAGVAPDEAARRVLLQGLHGRSLAKYRRCRGDGHKPDKNCACRRSQDATPKRFISRMLLNTMAFRAAM